VFGGEQQTDMPALDNDLNSEPWTAQPKNVITQRNSWARFLRRPVETDAIAMRALVEDTGELDVNSTYAYLLMATDFANTSIVADRDGELSGLITGYHPPTRPDVLFVWQVAVAGPTQGTGLASTMLDALVQRVLTDRNNRPITVEATVAPSNGPSRAFFGAFARRHGVPVVEQPHFPAAHLDADMAHDDEPMLRIGPLTTNLNAEKP
jgi:L-2,4-diaminobutyric acid acetyltransferase